MLVSHIWNFWAGVDLATVWLFLVWLSSSCCRFNKSSFTARKSLLVKIIKQLKLTVWSSLIRLVLSILKLPFKSSTVDRQLWCIKSIGASQYYHNRVKPTLNLRLFTYLVGSWQCCASVHVILRFEDINHLVGVELEHAFHLGVLWSVCGFLSSFLCLSHLYVLPSLALSDPSEVPYKKNGTLH